jgi:hypothetical protein
VNMLWREKMNEGANSERHRKYWSSPQSRLNQRCTDDHESRLTLPDPSSWLYLCPKYRRSITKEIICQGSTKYKVSHVSMSMSLLRPWWNVA